MHEGITECAVCVWSELKKYEGCMSESEEDTPVWSVGSLKTAGGCVILVSLEPGGWKYRCALGV